MSTDPFFHYPDQPHEEDNAWVFLGGDCDAQWGELLRYCDQRDFRAGETLIERDAYDRSCFFLESGELEVLIPVSYSNKLHPITVLGEGAVFGEQSFLDAGVRSATIRAVEPGRLFELRRERFDELAKANPALALRILGDLGRILSLRLRQATSFFSQDLV